MAEDEASSGSERTTDPDGDDGDRGRPDLADQRGVERVYQPAEDSRLLAEAATGFVEPGDRALDVGTGSGYVAEALSAAGADVLASDVNPHACRQARERGVAAVRADLVAPFREDAFDVVTFNPPYLPTDEDREWDDWMEEALSGGRDGRRLIDPFLEDLHRVLVPGGLGFVVLSSLTGIDGVRDYARRNGLLTREVASEKHPYERLVVLELTANH
ncbi:HemK2/MTQ2 family protein methyltransferase [Halomicrobium urmianum]|uniref:HemK2/MTQ2 family protein methyltransferase n=1 Tax=Halomicrobium urmianum TaxID=1586233 RepID=UPI001CD954EA|nr:HemK2/MTQ2 family protein methyltransferase [Halomicrobium urmianum]